jgi:hypothetical protein
MRDAGLSFGAAARLRQPDEEGCNWSLSILINGGTTPQQVYRGPADEVMREARARFNLLDED